MGEKMTVDAVASMVLQKLSDLLVDESLASNKKIAHRLECLKKVLETKSWHSFNDAAEEYLGHVYSIEDTIETFAVKFARQRKKLRFPINHALFLKKFTALKMLNFKLSGIQTEVTKLNSRTNSLGSISYRDRSPKQMESYDGDDGQEDEERELILVSSNDEETEGLSSSMKRTKSSHSIGNIEERPQNLRSDHSSRALSHSNDPMIRERFEHSKLMYSYSYNEEELPIVGYQDKVNKLRDRLKISEDRVIPIVGGLGSGKTMLARAVYGNRSINNMFEPSAWVNIFKESKTMEILLALLNQVNKSEVENRSNEDSLKQKLVQELTGRRYLVVLDGVQTWDQWEKLKDAFPDEGTGSKIIITTSNEADPKWQKPYNLRGLNCKESWNLFKRKVGSSTDPEAPLMERIIKVCCGLPLNIVLLGSLLSMKDRGKWSETLNSHINGQASDIMNLSYNDLDSHLKLCLIYMTLFPKELDIPVRRLQRLWLAEGLVERPQKDEFQEDVAEKYFLELVQRSLIMVSKQRSDGSARRCRLQGALHGLLLEHAQEVQLFHVHVSNAQEHTRRLIEYADAGNSAFELSRIQIVRSYISFNLQKKDTPAKHVGSLVSKMAGRGLGLLRVLDLEGVYKPSLPENLGDLFNLRYLGLRWTFLDKLPESVGDLPFLQTLDLKHTCIDKISTSIWKLKRLQHLNLDEVHLDKDALLHFRSSLPELLTLWGLSVNHESPIQNGLRKLQHLRELGITFRFIRRYDNNSQGTDNKSTEALVKWISQLTDLRSLRLRSKDDSGHPFDLSLKPFTNLRKLSHMKLLGKLQQLPPFEHFPPHIKVLTLSLSYLSEDPMPILGELPDLTVLRLLANSYRGEKMVCLSGTFKNLEVLKLWKLEALTKWEVEKDAMEKLKEVNIRGCSKLQSFPSSLLQQKTLQDLILNNMPPAFKEKIDKKYQFKVSTKDF